MVIVVTIILTMPTVAPDNGEPPGLRVLLDDIPHVPVLDAWFDALDCLLKAFVGVGNQIPVQT